MEILPLELPAGAVAFSTMRGDCRPGDPYSGFSTCDYTGDDAAHVAACRRELASWLGIGTERLVIPRQTHSARVAVISDPVTVPDLYGVDALVTACAGTALCIHTADCVPGVLFDPVARVAGAFHSGWRGTVGRIAARTVEAMVTLGADPGRISAAIGPSVSGECYETGEEVAALFTGELAGAVRRRGSGRPHIDLPLAVAATLKSAGVGRISVADACTYSEPARYFSARRLGIYSGRTVTCVMITPRP